MKSFQPDEKKYIREQLIIKGRDLFSMYGIRRTTIEDLTKTVGIGKGSFYVFFKSKEELFFQILIREVQKLANDNVKSLDMEKSTEELIKTFLKKAVGEVDSNPILNKLLIPEEFELLKRKIDTDGSEGNLNDFLLPMMEFLTILQSKGLIIQEKPLLLASVIRGLMLLTTHKREIGEEYFDDVMNFYVKMIAEKLTDVSKELGQSERGNHNEKTR